ADLETALPARLERKGRWKGGRGLPLGPKRAAGKRLAHGLLECGLRIERVDVRRAAVREDVDHPLRPARKVGPLWRQGIGGLFAEGLTHQIRQGERAHAQRAPGQELATRKGHGINPERGTRSSTSASG